MKRRLIIIAVVLAILALFGFRYMIVEKNDVLPEDVRLSLGRFFGLALAETVPAQPTGTPEVTIEPAPETASGAEDESTVIPPGLISDTTEEPTAEAMGEAAEIAPESTDGTAAEEPEADKEPVLKKGDSGDEVRALQKRLRELGFMTGAADGKFGPKTEQAVIEFKQHLYELEQERMAAEQAAAEAMAAQHIEAETATGETATAESATGETATDVTATDESATDETATAEAATGKTETGETATGETATAEAATGETATAESATDETATAESATGGNEDGQTEPTFDGNVDEEIYRLLVDKEFEAYQVKLAAGSRGAEVRRMQRRLKTLGYLVGKADGIFGRQTTSAVKTFQQQNKLAQDGIAGEKTQNALYSESAKKYVAPKSPVGPRTKGKPYFLKVSTKDQRVYAYSWNAKDGAYTNLVRTMVCSTGLANTPTPKGTYTSTTPVVRWGYFPKYDVWAQYLYRISGPYLFHSVLYDEADESTVKWGSVNKLGSPASHGCIRLSVEDAKWIYNNCPAGTTVTVY